MSKLKTDSGYAALSILLTQIEILQVYNPKPNALLYSTLDCNPLAKSKCEEVIGLDKDM